MDRAATVKEKLDILTHTIREHPPPHRLSLSITFILESVRSLGIKVEGRTLTLTLAPTSSYLQPDLTMPPTLPLHQVPW